MAKPVPIFKTQGETYRADTCVPLVQAMRREEIRVHGLGHAHYPGRKLSRPDLPGVQSVGHWDAETDQNWGLPWHRNEGIEFTFLESGCLGFATEERAYTLQPDDLTITRPWQPHRVGNPLVGASRLHWLILDVGVRRPNQRWKWPSWLLLRGQDRDELTNMLRHNEQPVWRGSGELRRCFRHIGHAVATGQNGSSVSRLTIRLNDFFLLLLDMLRKKKIRLDESLSGSRRTVELFLDDLRTHVDHLSLEWTVDEMARFCGLGTTQFVSHVRALTNMTPIHYLNHCRLELAARLLRDRPNTSITDVALECGFSTSQYFATSFAQQFGCSPRNFRTSGRPQARQAV